LPSLLVPGGIKLPTAGNFYGWMRLLFPHIQQKFVLSMIIN
jgi:hypothetical protein